MSPPRPMTTSETRSDGKSPARRRPSSRTVAPQAPPDRRPARVVGDDASVGAPRGVAELDGADARERRREAELEELERHRRLQPLDELVRRDDDHEPRSRGRNRLLARVGRAATLHDPPRRRDLVGPVDRDVELCERAAPENDSTARPSPRAASSVAREVATHRRDRPLRARAGSRYATVEPVPSPTRIPSATSSAAASAASCFSRSLDTDELLADRARGGRRPRSR